MTEASPRGRRLCSALALVAAMLVAGGGAAAAQEVIEGTEEVDFDRPEAWAMKYFSSLTTMTAQRAPTSTPPGGFELALEVDWVPQLDREERRVGFNGSKVEDLNKLPVLVRPRARVGLARRTALEIGYIPPLELRGVRANILSLAVEQLVLEGPRWSLGLRAYGQVGEIEGDFTCSAEDASIAAGDPGNEFGCQEVSSDTASLDHYGLAVVGGRVLGSTGGSLHFGIAATRHDLEFQVDALTYGQRDRTLLRSDGWTWSVSAGLSWPLNDRVKLGGELYYSPLDVRRSSGGGVENDALLNLRALLSYRLGT